MRVNEGRELEKVSQKKHPAGGFENEAKIPLAGAAGVTLTDASPFLAAIIEPIMSGTDVPTARTSTPITIALTPRMQAAPVANST